MRQIRSEIIWVARLIWKIRVLTSIFLYLTSIGSNRRRRAAGAHERKVSWKHSVNCGSVVCHVKFWSQMKPPQNSWNASLVSSPIPWAGQVLSAANNYTGQRLWGGREYKTFFQSKYYGPINVRVIALDVSLSAITLYWCSNEHLTNTDYDF